jgi:hypothetical protein
VSGPRTAGPRGAAAIVAAFRVPWLAVALYRLVAAIWLVPDRRIERTRRRH